MSNLNKIAKNTTMLFVSQIISYVLAFFYFLFMARYLGPDDFGIISTATAFTGLFGILMDLGFNILIVREVAKDKLLANKYLGNILTIKIILIFITVGLIILFSNLAGYSQQTLNVIYLLTISIIFSSFYGTFNSVFQAYEKMEYISISTVLNSVLILLGVILAVDYQFNVLGFALIYPLVNLIILMYCLFICFKKFFLPKLETDLGFWKGLIIDAIFIGLTVIFSTIYFTINSIMLSVISGNDAVGFFNAVYRLIFVLMFIPSVIITSILPVMSRHSKFVQSKLKWGYEKSFKFLWLISVFILVYGFMFADKIVLLFYGTEYIPSIQALRVLIWVIPPIFVGYLLTNVLYVVNKQKVVTFFAGINLIFNIILNLLLIPKFSFIGSSAVTVFCESLGFILLFIYTSKYFFKISIKDNIIKTVFIGLILMLFIYYLELNINWILTAILGAFLYVSLLFLSKVISKEDINLFKQLFKI